LVDEIQKDIKTRLDFEWISVNVAKMKREEYAREIRRAIDSKKPTLCFVDEITAKDAETWPRDEVYGYMETTSDVPRVFVIADSFGKNKGDLIAKLKSGDIKGHSADMMRRIRETRCHEIQPNTSFENILIFTNFLAQVAREKKSSLSRIQKACFFYVLVKQLEPREIRDLVHESRESISPAQVQFAELKGATKYLESLPEWRRPALEKFLKQFCSVET